jgi:hypothetical protein
VQRFLEELRAEGSAALLAGRCYERESVPFKAFDSMMDDLSRYLRRLPLSEARALMPAEVFALARLFPVLARVQAVAEAPTADIPDPQELQERAFAASAALFTRLRRERPLVVYVDDLQWTCRDSCVFMVVPVRAAEPTPLLLIVSHRSEGAEHNELLQRTLAAARRNQRIQCLTLPVGRLSSGASRELMREMLAEQAPTSWQTKRRAAPFSWASWCATRASRAFPPSG